MYKICFVMLASFMLAACSDQPDPFSKNDQTRRWYTQSQVDQGRLIYRDNCSQCHGKRGQGAPQWNKPDAQGFYPPPPLNGTAHSWHHPLPMLQRTINEGSRGRMPAWKGKLDEQQINAVIAYFQSWWPDQAYELWLKRHRR